VLAIEAGGNQPLIEIAFTVKKASTHMSGRLGEAPSADLRPVPPAAAIWTVRLPTHGGAAVTGKQSDQRLTRLRIDNSAKPSRTGPARRSAIPSNFPQPVNRTSSSPIQSALLAAYSRLPQTDAGEG
jgi:hypothetical protein